MREALWEGRPRPESFPPKPQISKMPVIFLISETLVIPA
ncbi:hypothetical protein GP5015_2040 [gamma proteobacterium HTCC5015]|nr:hypothetical protein GP5015_2040 [gamma proteobacterium HTCC5015]